MALIQSLFLSLLPGVLLSHYAEDSAPWTHIEANSEQRQPVYLGASPREMVLLGKRAQTPLLSRTLKKTAEKQALVLLKLLELSEAQMEIWPVQSIDDGKRTWAFARYRESESAPWQWFDSAQFDESEIEQALKSEALPVLPKRLLAWTIDRNFIFSDFLDFGNLYDKPAFGDCVWTNPDGSEIFGAWLPLSKLDEFKDQTSSQASPKLVCRAIPQTARFNDQPISFVIQVNPERVLWTTKTAEKKAPKPTDKPDPKNLFPLDFSQAESKDFKKAYREDVLRLAGAIETVFPLSGRQVVKWERKNSAQVDHELETFIDYLEERYEVLGFTRGETQDLTRASTRSRSHTPTFYRQKFQWRGIPQSNLIAVIPGGLPPQKNRPILMADHIDTAFCEDSFNQFGERVSAPGADDNVTAVAALLRGAEVLRNSNPLHDIWFVHLTGEEYPADDLGARHFVSFLLNEKQDIGGLILLDMVGFAAKGDRIFQINAGDSPRSVEMAQVALSASQIQAPKLDAQFRSRFDARSYLYNTDGVIFSDTGFPVILFNEHINAHENLGRDHYHETTDTPDKLDWNYVVSIVKTAIQTVATLATHE